MSPSALKKTQTTLMYFHVYFNCVEEYIPNYVEEYIPNF